MKNFTRIVIGTVTALLMYFSSYSQVVNNVAKFGIGSVNPAQKMEISGNNTVRIDGLIGTFLANPATPPSFLYVNALGDLYAMPVTNNSVLYNNAGIPTWTSPATIFNAWNFTGGNATSATYGTNFIGTINNVPLEFKGVGFSGAQTGAIGLIDPVNKNIYFGGYSTSGSAGNASTAIVSGATLNVAIGDGAMGTAVSGTSNNVYVGYLAGLLYKATTANSGSIGIGSNALRYPTTGTPNNAFGHLALGGSASFTTATNNLGFGYQSGYLHTTGIKDVSVGDYSLYNTSTGSYDVAVGNHALYSSTTTTGYNNAIGYYAEYANTTAGAGNAAEGYYAAYTNTGSRNVSIGYYAMQASNTNNADVAVGNYAGRGMGSNNITNGPTVAIGDSAFYSGSAYYKGVAVGYMALRAVTATTSTDVAVGFGALQNNSSTYAVAIGSQAWMKGTNTGTYSTVIGAGAGEGVSLGAENIAVGTGAMGSTSASQSGNYNIAIGSTNSIVNTPIATSTVDYGGTLANVSSTGNIGIGGGAGYNLTSASYNTIIGVNAGFNLTTPQYNVIIGYNAGYTETSGTADIIIGYNGANGMTTAPYNIAIGANTLIGVSSGTIEYNVALGVNANVAYGTLASNHLYNVAVGYSATAAVSPIAGNAYYNVAVGALSNASPVAPGTSQTTAGVAIGYDAQAIAANSVAIGANAYANTANTAILGSINGINGGTSNVSVGINKTTPAQALEVTGGSSTTGTIRIDGLNSGGSTYYKQTTTTSNIVYALNSTGDLYSLPNGTTGQDLILNASGAPTWGSPYFAMTATSPLSNTGSTVPNFLLSGTIGGVLDGSGGTGSFFTAAGTLDSILTELPSGNVGWANANATAGTNDNWGSQLAETDSTSILNEKTITGNGATAPLRLAQQSATNGQILAWNAIGNTWKPASFNSTLVTQSIAPASGSVITVANGNNSVVGGGNVTLDLQGTAGGILSGNGASSATFTSAGTAGYALTANGSGVPTWQPLVVPLPWSLTGNTGITPGTNFIGTLDDKQFRIFVTGISSAFSGNSGSIDPQLVGATAFANTYLGADVTNNRGAGNNDQGSYNTGIGYVSMGYASSSATYNVALGAYSLEANGSTLASSYTVAVGYQSMQNNDNGGSNETGIGYRTLGGISNILSNSNTAIGYQSMFGQAANATYYGSFNAATGYNSFYNSTTSAPASNTAIGSNAQYAAIASTNSALGDSALYSNSTGTLNTAAGYAANDSLSSLTNATTLGAQALAKQSNTLVLGSIKNNNTATANANVAIGTNAPSSDAALAIKKNHLESQGSLAAGNVFTDIAAGTGGSVNAIISNSNDVGGTISFTAGSSGVLAGEVVSAYFGRAYTYAPIVVISPANASAADAMTTNGAYVSSGTASFTISFNTAPTPGTTYSFNYFIIETPGTLAGAEPCYVPITVTNSAGSATPTGFQQMITVNSSTFSAYETAGLTNVEFSTGPSGSGTVLNAWLESVNNATYNLSTSTIYWVNLGTNTIPAGNSITLYMDFMASATMTGTGGVMGEAPQLSGSYGQNDNGPIVFPVFYDNFAGTSLSSNWSTPFTSGSGLTMTVNNGISFNFSSGSTATTVISSVNSYANPFVEDCYMTGSSPISNTRSYMPGLIANSATAEGNNVVDLLEPSDPSTPYIAFSNGRASVVEWSFLQGAAGSPSPGNDYDEYQSGSSQPNQVVSLFDDGNPNYIFINYSQVGYGDHADGPGPWGPTNNMYVALGLWGGTIPGSCSFSATWIRLRTYPPSQTMPTASVGGSVTCTGSGAQPNEPNPCDIPITLINNQSTPTSTGFQQQLIVNSSLYASAGEDANLDNIEFSTGPEGTGTVLQTWLESGNSNSSTSTVYWVNLGSNVIPANGSLTVYMDIMSSPVLSSAGPTGEAPQLSGTYAQYDNGGLVFPNVYTRWGGLSGGNVPTTVGTGAINGGGISIFNGSDITITDNTTNTEISYNTGDVGSAQGVAYSTTPTSVTTFPNVLESYVAMTGGYLWFGTGNGEEEEGTGAVIVWDAGWTNSLFGMKSNNQSAQDLTSQATTTNPIVWSMLMGSTSSLTSVLANYTQVLGTTTSNINLGSPTYYGYFGTAQNGGTDQEYIYWTRTRAYPPNGVMPTASLGSLSCCQPTAAPGSITGPTGTFCPGNTATYSISSVPGATSYLWSVPSGTIINSGQGTTSINVTYGSASGVITVEAINSCGAASSPSSTSALTSSFSITGQPANASTSCTTGSVATFTVTAAPGTFTYQWQVSTDGGATWSNVSNGGIYSGATTATLTVTAPTFTQNLNEYRCQVTGTCGGSAVPSNAATLNVYGNLPITITNSQSTATPTNFPQMITINSSLYTAQEMSGLQNVEFTVGGPAGTGTPLQSWLESGNTNTSTNTVYWVNLGSNIIAGSGGTLTIYMNFMSSNVLSAAGPAGEAPQLSGSGANYALYDNGANIFNTYYTNFAGTSMPAGLSITAGTATVNNGLTIPAAGQNVNIISGSVGYNFTQNILETDGHDGTGLGSNANDRYLVWNDQPTGATNAIYITGSYYIYGTCAGPAAIVTSGVTGDNIWSLWQNSGNAIGTYNYTTSTSASSSCSTSSSYYISLGTAGGGSYYQYVRIRVVPPGGVMPSSSAGSLTCCSTPPSLGSITGPTGPFCPGATATYSVSAAAGASSYTWTVPAGATITSGQGSTSINVTYGNSGGNITVTAQNSCNIAGVPSTLAVTDNFSITSQPANASTSCATGSTATFSVTGTGTNTYQWQVSTDGGATWNNISNGGIYSGVTLSTLTISNPPTADNGYQYRCVLTSTTCGGTLNSNGATLNVYGNVPITITNSQSTATPTNFPQMITVNSSSYTAQELSGLQNVEFTIGAPAGTGTPLQSWLESGNTNTSTSTVYWVNLGSNTIPASSSITVYMNFMASNVLSSSGPAGEAPQLSGATSPNYGKYDNGSLVFPTFYDNFSGTSLASQWTNSGGANIAVSNGLTLTNNGNNWFGPYTNTFSSALGNVAESYCSASAVGSGGTGLDICTGISSSSTGMDAQMDANIGYGSGGSVQSAPGANQNFFGSNIVSANTYYVFSVSISNTPGPVEQVNYGAIGSLVGNSGTAVTPANSPVGLGVSGATGSFQWFRIRPNAPNSVMPTATAGSLSCCTAAPAVGSITGPTGPFCPGATATYSITAVAGASSYVWTVPTGATITSGQGTVSINVTYGNSGGNITVAAENVCGLEGTPSTLAVTDNFSITAQPTAQTVSCATGGSVSFSVTVTGTNTYQWQVDSTGTWSNIIGSRNGVYSGYTTNTLTIAAPPFSMNGFQYRCVITSVSCGGTLTSNAATLNVYGNIPITLTNSQTTATSTGFQEMITVNSANYTSQEMTGLQNVEFTVGGPAGTGTQLSSWLESGNTNTSTSTVYWINLGTNTIAANGGTLTIYMNFMPTNILSSGPSPCAGEAPDLSATYAQYDNGGIVFPNVYTRWGGNTGGILPTTTGTGAINGGGIAKAGYACTSTISTSYPTITNFTSYTQVQFTNSCGTQNPGLPNQNVNGVYYSSTPSSSYIYPTVIESKVNIGDTYGWFGTGFGQEEEGYGAIIANDNNNGSNPYYSVRSDFNFQGTGTDCATGTGTHSLGDYSTLSEPNTSPYVWSILLNWNGTNDQITNATYNYASLPGVSFPLTIDGTSATNLQTGCALSTLFGYFGTTQNGSNTYPYEQIYWTRTRIYPPAGVMPTASFYGLTCCNSPATPGSITSTPTTTTYCPGATATYSIAAVGGVSSYVWTVPAGSSITSGQGTTSVNVTLGTSSGNVSVTTTNSCGESSSPSNYSVTSLTAFTTQPSNAGVSCANVGTQSANFTVGVTGATAWQWQVSTDGGATWTSLTNTAPYSNVTTATMTVTTPSTAYNGYEFRCIVTTPSCGSATSNVATLTVSSLNSVKITVTNSQGTATATNFQQMLTINFTGYGSASPALLSNLSNVEFSTGPGGTGTPLYAWFENSSTTTPAAAPSSSSTAAVVWVNLGSDIVPASSSISIYMTFMPSAVMGVPTGATAYTGEAPELTGTYGQYDNGALVFNTFYDDFAGSSLDANWTSYSGQVNSTLPTIAVSNGLTITTAAPTATNPPLACSVGVISSANSYAPNLIAEAYAAGSAAVSAERSLMPGLISNTANAEGYEITDFNASYGLGASSNSYLCYSNGRNALQQSSWLQGSPTSPSPYDDYNEYTGPYQGTTPYTVIGLVYSPTANYMYFNYVLEATGNASYSPATGTNMYFALGAAAYNGAAANVLNSYWARIRNYPPNNTMPSAPVLSTNYGCF